jgi:hypothetical protein
MIGMPLRTVEMKVLNPGPLPDHSLPGDRHPIASDSKAGDPDLLRQCHFHLHSLLGSFRSLDLGMTELFTLSRINKSSGSRKGDACRLESG